MDIRNIEIEMTQKNTNVDLKRYLEYQNKLSESKKTKEEKEN